MFKIIAKSPNTRRVDPIKSIIRYRKTLNSSLDRPTKPTTKPSPKFNVVSYFKPIVTTTVGSLSLSRFLLNPDEEKTTLNLTKAFIAKTYKPAASALALYSTYTLVSMYFIPTLIIGTLLTALSYLIYNNPPSQPKQNKQWLTRPTKPEKDSLLQHLHRFFKNTGASASKALTPIITPSKKTPRIEASRAEQLGSVKEDLSTKFTQEIPKKHAPAAQKPQRTDLVVKKQTPLRRATGFTSPKSVIATTRSKIRITADTPIPMIPIGARPRGIINEGNQCYFNTALQVMMRVPGLLEAINEKVAEAVILRTGRRPTVDHIDLKIATKEDINTRQIQIDQRDLYDKAEELYLLQQLFRKVLSNTTPQDLSEFRIPLKKLLNIPVERLTDDTLTAQHDANEALTYLLGIVNYNRFKLTSTVIFGHPPQLSETYDPSTGLSIEVTGNKSSYNLQDCIDSFFSEERLTGINQYRFKDATYDASKQIKIDEENLPDSMFLQLKLYEYNIATQTRRKIQKPVNIPKNSIVTIQEKHYRIIASAQHSGGSSGGHYFAEIATPDYTGYRVLNDSSRGDIISRSGSGTYKANNFYFAALERVR